MSEQQVLTDPNAPAVIEVFDFFATGRIHHGSEKSPLAQEHLPLPVATYEQARRSIEGKTYKAVIAAEFGRLCRLHDTLPFELKKPMTRGLLARGEFYRPYLTQELIDDPLMLSQISGDAAYIAFHRMLEGAADTFFERQFALYRAGWLPCGWEGVYPDGRFKAYRPQG